MSVVVNDRAKVFRLSRLTVPYFGRDLNNSNLNPVTF